MLRNTTSTTKQMLRMAMISRKIRCKAWRDWMLLVHDCDDETQHYSSDLKTTASIYEYQHVTKSLPFKMIVRR